MHLHGHDLEAIEALLFKIGNDFVRTPLFIGAPALNVVQNVDAGGVLRLDGTVLFFAKNGPVHRREVDNGNSQGAVHVEHNASQTSGLRSGAGDGGRSCH